MNARFEFALQCAVLRITAGACPDSLREAVHDAVLSGGQRWRPSLCYLVASAGIELSPALTDAGAVAIELVHCASLVQDDLPMFDNALTRRGRPSLHARFGETTALLAADTMIVGAFEVIAAAGARHAAEALRVVSELSRASGAAAGAIGGQALEQTASWSDCHAAKTGALFGAAAAIGAVVSSQPVRAWRPVGELIGCAYQLADDLADASLVEGSNAVHEVGITVAAARMQELRELAATAVPICAQYDTVVEFIHTCIDRMLPATLT